MQGKIGLEEHFAIPETLGDSKGYLPDHTWPDAHITLAWYGLAAGSFDPLQTLREAVLAWPESLAEIRANQDFARVPGLIDALEESARGQ